MPTQKKFPSKKRTLASLLPDVAFNVYAGSWDNDLVYKFDSDGNEIWTFSGHSSTIQGVAVDQNGNVYSGSADGTVRKLDSSGTQVWSYDSGGDRFGLEVAVDPGTVGAGFQ